MSKKVLFSITGACLLLVLLTFSVTTRGDAGRTLLCHATHSDTNPYQLVEIPPNAINAHLDEHGTLEAGDFYPKDDDCNTANDPPPGGGDPPGATPEPITMLLFGAGLAGVGLASRRLRKKGDQNE